jgi:transcriptional regulator with XRE-family HTH domain
MSFRENLKSQLRYADIQVKELAVLSGIKRQTIASYLTTRGRIPSADVAVRIAKALKVTVEYLVDGTESSHVTVMNLPLHRFGQSIEKLSEEDRKIVYETAFHLIEAMQKRKEYDKRSKAK